MTLPKLNNDICFIISKYLIEPEYKLLDWIDINNINYILLNLNNNAISFLNENRDNINLNLSSNPAAIELLKENRDKIDWFQLSKNPNAIELLRENPDKINWFNLSLNPNAIELLRENRDKINYRILSSNPSIFELDHNKNKELLENKVIDLSLL